MREPLEGWRGRVLGWVVVKSVVAMWTGAPSGVMAQTKPGCGGGKAEAGAAAGCCWGAGEMYMCVGAVAAYIVGCDAARMVGDVGGGGEGWW
jgi:hypothetical protein